MSPFAAGCQSSSGGVRARIGGVYQLESSKPAKVSVHGTQRGAVLNGERGQRGVSHERPRYLGLEYLALEEFPEALACADDAYIHLI